MKAQAIILLTILVSSCAIAPQHYEGRAFTPVNDTYTCVMRQLTQLGYTVQDADRGAGFIRAEKQTSGLGTALLVGQHMFDQISVTVLESSEGALLRIAAGSANQQALGFNQGSRNVRAPSTAVKKDGEHIMSQCANSSETVRPSANFED
jgi:hypothetical protein